MGLGASTGDEIVIAKQDGVINVVVTYQIASIAVVL